MKTWMLEHAAVVAVLLTTWALTGRAWLELVGCAAVYCAFGHAAVADRLAEQEERRRGYSVPCYPKLKRYFVAKEFLWLGYFAAHQSWAAIAGVAVFLAYPAWRRVYRSWRPLGRTS